MFAAERIEPTEKQIKHRSQQIAKWRNQIPKSGWGIGKVNARLLARALGMPADYFMPDPENTERQQEEMAEMKKRLDELQDQVEELRRASGI